MQKCPKCSSQYGDDSKICRTCGAILETVAVEPPAAVEGDPSPQQEDTPHESPVAKQHSWTCSQCGQSVPGDFEVCWNCGTSREGIADPSFSRELAIDEDQPRTWQPSTQGATDEPSSPSCPRCGSSKIIPGTRIVDQGQHSDGRLQVLVEGDPDALIFKDRLYDRLTADICGDCGHVELTVERPNELYEHYLRSQE